MDQTARKIFNQNFTVEKYKQFLTRLDDSLPSPVQFRVAETPVFLSDDFKEKLIAAGDEIIQTILKPNFKQLTERAVPAKWNVANENDHPHFITLDFGICKDDHGQIVPKLIEMQGFPSLYGFQVLLADTYREIFDLDAGWDIYFGGFTRESYLELLKETLLGPYRADEVVIMDVNAFEQKTAVDFYYTQKLIGLPIVSLADLIAKGEQLFYEADGEMKPIKRIYNRLIFDELESDLQIFDRVVDIREAFDVEWVTHPNWFYRISKFTMPFLKGEYIPETRFLNDIVTLPINLEDYVLKPLFSFAGQGVIIDVTLEAIEQIHDPENWILQQKVNYEPVVQSPEGGVKAEIRLLYLWPDGAPQPTLAINLARLSRGKMIGVRYNKDFDWVGGTVAFMKK